MQKHYANLISWSSLFINFLIVTLTIFYNLNPLFFIIAILIASIFDLFDGKVARKYNKKESEKTFGQMTDSFCDILNFGFIPSIIFLYIFIGDVSFIILFLTSFLFVWGGAFRLARFHAVKQIKGFIGVPITIIGPLMMANVVILSNIYLVLLLTWFMTYLMVANIKVKKF